jgi:signal transduction histidine kinase
MMQLKRQFPMAKQVVFVPMFHANFNRWTACIAYTSSFYRVFSYSTDYLYTLAFCNAIRAEVVRMATMFADQQKGDFIGSVSHELRSPLHGILAAIEFLQDTDCSTFQRSCLDTADACAQTLLDTGNFSLILKKPYSLRAS